mgnify:FL=1
MNMATKVEGFLQQSGLEYDTLTHEHSHSSLHTAHAAHIPEEQLAKSVILEDDLGYVMAVIPASSHVKLRELNKLLHRNMGLTTETNLAELFNDCEAGAIPPLGQAYGLQTIVDNKLDACSDVYFESGNHEELVHMRGDAFSQLMKKADHASICRH